MALKRKKVNKSEKKERKWEDEKGGRIKERKVIPGKWAEAKREEGREGGCLCL